MYNFSESSKGRMQRFEEPQFGHPYIRSWLPSQLPWALWSPGHCRIKAAPRL